MYDFEKGRIKLIRGGRYPQCHSLFIDDGMRVLIDAASNEDVLLALKDQGPVHVLINSHAHEDHLLYNHRFESSEFWVHEKDAHAFEDVENLVDCYGEMDDTARQGWIDFLLGPCHYRARKADRLIEGGEVMELGTVRMEVVHTPGHTPGHCAFYFPQEKVLFTGDLDLVKAGPYYGDLDSSLEDTITSIERLKSYPCDVYLTGHGKGVFEGDPVYLDRYQDCIRQREAALMDYLAGAPRTLDEITDQGIIYGPKKEVGGIWDLAMSERAMMLKHLDFLRARGRVRRDGEHYVLDS
ncbi:MAG: MBL fold metallo-hydrolase [Proteobacteria bacterium]|nr:MBL fold metallo-hydrolase [Pseudomonadota bacterium]